MRNVVANIIHMCSKWLKFVFYSLVFLMGFNLMSRVSYSAVGSRYWGLNGTLVSDYTDGAFARVVPDLDGGVFVVWEKDQSHIYAQRISPEGDRLWGDNGVLISGSGAATRPYAICNGSGDIIAAWEYSDGVDTYIAMQKVNTNGEVVWTDHLDGLVVSDTIAPSDRDLVDTANSIALVSDGGDGGIVVYASSTAETAKAVKVDGDGNILWGGGVALSSNTVQPTNVSAVGDTLGGVYATWFAESGVGTNHSIYAQYVSSEGYLGYDRSDLVIAAYSDPAVGPTDIKSALGQSCFYVFWNEYTSGSESKIKGQSVDDASGVNWDAGGTTFYTRGMSSSGDVALTSDHIRPVVVFFGDTSIIAKQIDTDKAVLWTAEDSVDGGFGFGDSNHAATLGTWGYVIFTNQTSLSGQKLLIQKLDVSGNPLWDTDTFGLNDTYVSSTPVINYSVVSGPYGEDTGYAIWSSGTENNYRYYVQKFGDAYQIDNLDLDADALNSLDRNVEIGSEYGVGNDFDSNTDTISVKDTDGNPISAVSVVFTGDLDWTGVSGETDTGDGKSVIVGLDAAPGAAETHSLYIPKVVDHSLLYICPGATSLVEVTVGCTSGYQLETDDPSVSEETVDAQDYWVVSGLTGTGGEGIPDTTSLDMVISDTSVETGDTISVTITAQDELGDTDVNYVGTVEFSSTSGDVTLPSNYTFTAGDAGVHTFTDGVTFNEAGTFTLTITDTGDGDLTDTSNDITVEEGVDSTGPTAPGKPKTKSPTNSDTPTWRWTASTDADPGLASEPYIIKWSKNQDFSGSEVYTATSSTNSFEHTSGLSDGTWYAKVKAVDGDNNYSAYSERGEVEIDTNGPKISDITKTPNELISKLHIPCQYN
ncbi:MAG: hypothetical protein ACD_22C00076G0008, partial [uncultured bacterium]